MDVDVDGAPTDRDSETGRSIDRGDRPDARLKDEGDEVPERQRHADARDEQRDGTLITDRSVDEPVYQQRDDQGGEDGDDEPDHDGDGRGRHARAEGARVEPGTASENDQAAWVEPPPTRHEERRDPADERPAREHIAVGEVREVQDGVGHGEADPGQPDDHADDDAIPEERGDGVGGDASRDQPGEEVDEQDDAGDGDESRE